MYRVIVIDDEPAALTHLCSVIEKRCPDFSVIDVAENGIEGLDKIHELRPDLVISDVKMPLMSGVELVKTLKEENFPIYSIIVSGYQDFEYARSAIQSGVCDYILKPIIPNTFCEAMGHIADKLKADYYQARNSLVRKLCEGVQIDQQEMRKFFPYSRYYGAIVRRNGLPKRFNTYSNLEIYSDINEAMIIYGRDEMESLILMPGELLYKQKFRDYILSINEHQKNENEYLTIAYDNNGFQVDDLPKKVKELYRFLDTISVIGLSQIVDISGERINKEIQFDHEKINEKLKTYEDMVAGMHYDKLKKELDHQFTLWGEEKRPQLWMEYMAHQILHIIRKYNSNVQSMVDCEYMLEDAFFYSPSISILKENLFEIFFLYVKEDSVQTKVDSPEFFELISQYLGKHLDENITLQMICKQFSVSQTYMSRLFRKYTQLSYNQYFTNLRMEKAKELIEENKDFLIKDIANLVGYQDQFYFSRIFRSYTGKCPSEYVEK